MARRHNVVVEGMIVGAVGAAALAVWFLIVDTISGRPLHTPLLLGQTILSVLGPSTGDSGFVIMALYSIIHFAAFFVVGMIVVALVHASERAPSVTALLLMMFVIFMLGFYAVVGLLAEALLAELAWYNILIGNLIAAGLMGWLVLRRHPRLTGQFESALGGRPD